MAGSFVANQLNTDTGVFQNNNAFNGMAKAWVIFNGASPTIYGQHNVSSITRNAAGDYTINFLIPMVNANYSVIGSSSLNTTSAAYTFVISNAMSTTPFVQAPTTTACRIVVTNSNASSGVVDAFYTSVAIFGQ